jgi:hypothetical protein
VRKKPNQSIQESKMKTLAGLWIDHSWRPHPAFGHHSLYDSFFISGQPLDERQNTMGDKSPKERNKHATQKQTKANSDRQRKQQAISAKQAAGKKQ